MNAVTSWVPILEGRKHASQSLRLVNDCWSSRFVEKPKWCAKNILRIVWNYYTEEQRNPAKFLIESLCTASTLTTLIFLLSLCYFPLTAYFIAFLSRNLTIFDLLRPITFLCGLHLAHASYLIWQACNVRIRYKRAALVKHTSRNLASGEYALLTPQHTQPLALCPVAALLITAAALWG